MYPDFLKEIAFHTQSEIIADVYQTCGETVSLNIYNVYLSLIFYSDFFIQSPLAYHVVRQSVVFNIK
jgi:hypothetical protein